MVHHSIGIYALGCIQHHISVSLFGILDLGLMHWVAFSMIYHLSGIDAYYSAFQYDILFIVIWVGFYYVLLTLQLIYYSVHIVAYGYHFHVVSIHFIFPASCIPDCLLWIFPEQISAAVGPLRPTLVAYRQHSGW